MTNTPKPSQPVFDLFIDTRVSKQSIRHKIGVACKDQDGEGLTLEIEGMSTLIIALPVVEKPNSDTKAVIAK